MKYQKTADKVGTYGRDWYGEELDMGDLSQLYRQEDFQGMSRDELSEAITGIYDPQMEALRKQGIYSEDYGLSSLATGGGYRASGDWEYGGGNLKELSQMTSKDRELALFEDYQSWYDKEAGTSADWKEMDYEKFLEGLEGDVGYERRFSNVGFEEGDLDELLDYTQAIQEGMGRMGSISERFDLKGQLASEEMDVERESRKALQSYIPREITSRYGALQAGGGGDLGEADEAKYLANLSAGQRRRGRNVRSIYGELEDKMFGGLGDWIKNMTS